MRGRAAVREAASADRAAVSPNTAGGRRSAEAWGVPSWARPAGVTRRASRNPRLNPASTARDPARHCDHCALTIPATFADPRPPRPPCRAAGGPSAATAPSGHGRAQAHCWRRSWPPRRRRLQAPTGSKQTGDRAPGCCGGSTPAAADRTLVLCSPASSADQVGGGCMTRHQDRQPQSCRCCAAAALAPPAGLCWRMPPLRVVVSTPGRSLERWMLAAAGRLATCAALRVLWCSTRPDARLVHGLRTEPIRALDPAHPGPPGAAVLGRLRCRSACSRRRDACATRWKTATRAPDIRSAPWRRPFARCRPAAPRAAQSRRCCGSRPGCPRWVFSPSTAASADDVTPVPAASCYGFGALACA